MARFADKIVIVTGAGSGIGEAAARRFATEGATLVLADRDTDGLNRVADSLDETKVATLAGDVSKMADCKALAKLALDQFGRIDVLINNAGVDHLGKIDEGDLGEFTKVIETDVYGVVQMSRAAIAALRESRGCIINISSVSGLGGDWNHSFYCTAKGAVTNFTRALAMDEARNGVRVNAVNPSLVYTPFTAGMKEQPDLVAAFEARIPMGRGAEPDDIVGVVAFLASEDAHFVTGVNLPVDGGLSASNGQPPLSERHIADDPFAVVGKAMTTLYDFIARRLDGSDEKLARYDGQVLLVVNTASQCGFTPQYSGLEAIQRAYAARGFAVLGFPCNQFGNQEPGDESAIQAFCDRTYGISFPMFAKVEVNGAGTHPLYRYLKTAKPGFLGLKGIKWNFTKFLVDRQGKVAARFGPTTKPEALAKRIEELL